MVQREVAHLEVFSTLDVYTSWCWDRALQKNLTEVAKGEINDWTEISHAILVLVAQQAYSTLLRKWLY